MRNPGERGTLRVRCPRVRACFMLARVRTPSSPVRKRERERERERRERKKEKKERRVRKGIREKEGERDVEYVHNNYFYF
jgi:hypothetical protein